MHKGIHTQQLSDQRTDLAWETMEKEIARNFNEKVQALIYSEQAREELYATLREYQEDHETTKLVLALRDLLNEPKLIQLYDDIRSLVPAKHQIEYDRLAPKKLSDRLRVIRLNRRANEGLGFSVRGGLEHGVGIVVSDVESDSPASLQGLQIGDEIVRLNGFTISQAIKEEVLSLIKARNELVLKVKNIGMLPVREHADDKVAWKYIDAMDPSKALQQVLDGDFQQQKSTKEISIHINLPLYTTLGCSICSDPEDRGGIFIQSVKPGSMAEEAGLEVGDQIAKVNGMSLRNATHSEAVVALKGSRQLDLVIRKHAGVDLFRPDLDVAWLGGATGKGKMSAAERLTKRKTSKEKRRNNEADSPKEESPVDNVKQEVLIQQAIEVIEGKEVKTSASDVLPGHMREVHVEVHETMTSSSSDESKHKRGRTSREFESPVYMSSEKIQKFRIQKPVLLHPTHPTSKLSSLSLSPPIPEEPDPNEHFTAETFNPNSLFTNEQIAGRTIKLVTFKKAGSEDLGLVLESQKTRFTSGLMVVEIYEGGAVHKQGGIHVGDQVMMVAGHHLIDVDIEDAYEVLKEDFLSGKTEMQMVVAKALNSDAEEEVLPRPDYDIPISNLDDYLSEDGVDISMYNDDVPVSII